jgi:hypothetical protein
MQPAYERVHQLLLGRSAPRSAADPAVQMFCRVGFPLSDPQPTPRRELASILTSTKRTV